MTTDQNISAQFPSSEIQEVIADIENAGRRTRLTRLVSGLWRIDQWIRGVLVQAVEAETRKSVLYMSRLMVIEELAQRDRWDMIEDVLNGRTLEEFLGLPEA